MTEKKWYVDIDGQARNIEEQSSEKLRNEIAVYTELFETEEKAIEFRNKKAREIFFEQYKWDKYSNLKEKNKDVLVDEQITKMLDEVFTEVFDENEYSFPEHNSEFIMELKKGNISISTYDIGRIYSLSDLFGFLFKIDNPFSELVKEVVQYDLTQDANISQATVVDLK